MELDIKFKNITCVYKITCVVNNKILIGSTTNLYKRIAHYKYDINKPNPLKHYNKRFYDDLLEYGFRSFKVEIVESYSNISDKDLKNKETYYMNLFDSLNPDKGYNIRQDIDGRYICAESTREIKRMQTKEQWASGIRLAHSSKMKNYWANNNARKIEQSNLMKSLKTKYVYTIINRKTKEVVKDNIEYKDLHIYNFHNLQLAQRFCYINKMGRKTSINNIDSDDPNVYLNTLVVGEYFLTRKLKV